VAKHGADSLARLSAAADAFEAGLASTDPWLRRHYGVYTTPREVVSAQVRVIQDLLKRQFGLARGFGEPDVVVVDPATGTGAYPLGIAALGVGCGLAARLRLFEPLGAAAAIARQQVSGALGARVEVLERDALAEPWAIDAPLLVCLGNPPYNRQVVEPGRSTPRKGGWIRFGTPRALLDDFVDPAVGVHLKSLYNDYVYFWRWAVWLVCEQRRGPGVVSLITPTSFLHGPGFAGMRAWLRRELDLLWVLDLEGDGRGTRVSENVFQGVQTPVAICLGARLGDRAAGTPADVRYARVSGTRRDKLDRLAEVRRLDDLAWQRVSCATLGAPLVVVPRSQYQTWPRLTDLFSRQYSGCQMKRRWPIAPSPETLRQRWKQLLRLPLERREQEFGPTRDRSIASAPSGLTPLRDLSASAACPEPVRYAYRSFDRQWLLADPRLGDFMRPRLWQIAGPRQIFLTSLLTHPPGPGPAAVATRLVPDLDHFRGSFGGKAVVPLWCDWAGTEPNLVPGLLGVLSRAYGMPVTAEAFLGYCYALLGTPAYQARFDAELRTPGPRVPLTSSAILFERTARLGQQLLRLHTFEAVPRGRARVRRTGARLADATIDHIDAEVIDFSVSGLRVVRSWLRYRRYELWSAPLASELRELLWLIEATLALRPALDALLDEVVAGETLPGYAWSCA
jgi:predicted helicase